MRAIQITHGQKTLIRKVIIAFGEMLSIAAKKETSSTLPFIM